MSKNMNDNEIESLLRRMPLARPSTHMDGRVMSARRQRLPWIITIGSPLAAAAAVLLVLTLNWNKQPTGPAAAISNAATGGGTAAVVAPASDGGLVPEMIIHDVRPMYVDYKRVPGVGTVEEIRQQNTQKTIWVDSLNGIHIETTSEPHEEVIMTKVQVN